MFKFNWENFEDKEECGRIVPQPTSTPKYYKIYLSIEISTLRHLYLDFSFVSFSDPEFHTLIFKCVPEPKRNVNECSYWAKTIGSSLVWVELEPAAQFIQNT